MVKGLVLRQIMPMVRDGFGPLKRAMDTGAERVSTATAISGINVTPIPAPTIWTSVDSELRVQQFARPRGMHIAERQRLIAKAMPLLQQQQPHFAKRFDVGRRLALVLRRPDQQKSSANSATSANEGSDTGRATIAVSSRPSASSWISFGVSVSRTLMSRSA